MSQSSANSAPAETLMLYHSDLCGYCWRVRGVIEELGIDVELRDIYESPQWAGELREARGRMTVPVLRRINSDDESDWMPESGDIIRYLQDNYS